MEAKEFDFDFPRGDTCPVKFNLVDGDKNPLTPTATTEIYFTLKKNYNKTDYILQKKLTTGDLTIVDGVCTFTLTHQDTMILPYGKYVYDVQFKDGNYVKTILIGQIELTDEATHYANE